MPLSWGGSSGMGFAGEEIPDQETEEKGINPWVLMIQGGPGETQGENQARQGKRPGGYPPSKPRQSEVVTEARGGQERDDYLDNPHPVTPHRRQTCNSTTSRSERT